ncbi:amino acid ABC transporter permease [Devosia sediminis]|uniref:Amino acid ABC transporter permease n=1 Tax=Devosia sediminis TaxID=2798801 RepID=A0A934MJ42_9HYPH|nr:amino acid ABC transporter permease [Devosia sediminis]MBJ3783663.1 amino acid ABC transporter permease [Devosia sediminis]
MTMQSTATPVQLLPRRDYVTPVLWVVLFFMVLGVVINLFTNPRWRWDVVSQYIVSEQILAGLATTLWLTALSGIVGIAIGLVTAAMRLSKRAPLRMIASVYIALSRAIPALVLILFIYFFAALVPNIEIGLPFLPPLISVPTNSVITQFAAAVIGLTFILGAHLGEIFRGGVLSVDKGQQEAARALGMPPSTTQLRVILPQAIRVSTPAGANDLISLFKNTSLVSIIGYTELLTTVQSIYARTYETIPLLLVACIWYMALTLLAMGAQRLLERRMSRGFSR